VHNQGRTGGSYQHHQGTKKELPKMHRERGKSLSSYSYCPVLVVYGNMDKAAVNENLNKGTKGVR
jgi:hypothetical protein